MQREARSGFATSTGRECTIVLDRPGAVARREIDRDAPPPFRFFTTNGTIITFQEAYKCRKQKNLNSISGRVPNAD